MRRLKQRPHLLRMALGLLVSTAGACATPAQPPLRGRAEPVDLSRFMGQWYVLAHIPIHVPPLFSEKGAWNGIESYALAPDGTIETTYTFRRGGLDGPRKRFTPRARVANPPVHSEWKMKFFWYLPAGDFLILDVDDAYRTTVIGVPDRSYVWIMARSPALPDAEYRALVERVASWGYDVEKLVRVPQRW